MNSENLIYLEALAQLQRLEREATPAPWYVAGPPWGDGTDLYTGNGDPHSGRFVCSVNPLGVEEGQAEIHGERNLLADAKFIEVMRNHLPRVLADYQRLLEKEPIEDFAEEVRRTMVKIMRAVQHNRPHEAGELAALLCTRSATIVQQAKMREEQAGGEYDLKALAQYPAGTEDEDDGA